MFPLKKLVKDWLVLCVFATVFHVDAVAFAPVVPCPKEVVELGESSGFRNGSISVRMTSGRPVDNPVVLEISEILSERTGPKLKVQVRVRTMPEGPESYRITRKGNSVRIVAGSKRAVTYSLQTLKQLVNAEYDKDFAICDWPDVRHRVFMDDVSRGEVPTVAQIKAQIRLASELKYNAISFYIEDVVRVPSHPDFAPEDGCYTVEDLDEITEYAGNYGVDLVGGFQCFGHFERILSHPQYRHLGVTDVMIDADSPEARKFLDDVLSDLSAHCSSEYFCVYCDETFDLERIADKEAYYARHITYLSERLRSYGKRAVVCGDMMLKYPRIMDMIPRDVVIMTWNYDAARSFGPWLEPFKDKGFELWVAPGVHSSNRMLPDMRAAEGNRRFITEGLAAGATGSFVCTWDESTFHSVKHLYYGLAQFAETMWDTRRAELDDEFRTRYEMVFFGRPNGAADVFDSCMTLAEIPIFSGMNDRVFYQRFVPLPGEPLVIDTSSLADADSLLTSLETRMDAALASAVRGNGTTDELSAWKYILDCYRFMVDARFIVNDVVAGRIALSAIDGLIDRCKSLKQVFKAIWQSENQPHMLEEGIASFDAKIASLESLKANLKSGIQLAVKDRQNPYMCFWLTSMLDPHGGRLDVKSISTPTPGQRFTVGTGEYKWTKTESLSGLSMDLNLRYPDSELGSVSYSYAQLNSTRELDLKLLVGFVGTCSVYVNGAPIMSSMVSNSFSPDAYELPFHIHEGVNDVFVVLEKQFPECSFSALVDGAATTSRKHKYSISLGR